MDPDTKAKIAATGGKIAGQVIRMVFSRSQRRSIQRAEPITETEPTEITASVITESTTAVLSKLRTKPTIALPTPEETTIELKRRLGRELYKAELDLAGGLLIAGKPCDCLDNKHTLLLEAASEELVSQDPSNPVYLEIIQWVGENQPKVTIEAIQSGQYREQYPAMALKFKEFRKRVLGTAAFSAMGDQPQTITLEEAKKLAATEAEKEVEKKWQQQEEVSH